MLRWNEGIVAPAGTQWARDNQYSYSMFLSTKQNIDIHHQRVDNKGMLKARFEGADELDGLEVDIQTALNDEVDTSEYPSLLNFLPVETFREVLEQKPPTMDDISVAFPMQNDWQTLQELVVIDKHKLFMAKPPAPSVAYEDLTPIQQLAVDVGVDMKQKILYVSGIAGSGKSELALHVCQKLPGRVQVGAATGKAAANFNGTTLHSMFGWSFDDFSGGKGHIPNSRKLEKLKTFYENTDIFIVDEVNACSAAMLAQLDECMTAVFNPSHKKDKQGNILPFGDKKMIFLGDAAQLRPVCGEPIHCADKKAGKVRGCRGKRQAKYHQTSRGHELYRKYLEPNCIVLLRGQRNSGILQRICDRLRNGTQTDADLTQLTFQRTRFPDFMPDFGIHYDNESCSLYNWRQLWSTCKAATPPSRLYICKATYHTTNNNQPVVDALAALPPTKYNFASDVLCVSEGCDVRLIHNLNVGAGLVNSASGRVVRVIYNNADVPAILAGKNPPPYCIVVDFPSFRGFPVVVKPTNPKEPVVIERTFPYPSQPQCVPIYRQKFRVMRSDIPSWVVKLQKTSECYREQFPLDLSTHITTHRAQGSTLRDCAVSVDLCLDNPDRRMPSDIGSIMYVACTRVNRLEDLFVSPVFPSVWTTLGQSTGDIERRKTEAKLKEAAGKFASERGKYQEMKEELEWKPDFSNCDNEWEELTKQTSEPARRVKALERIPDADLVTANNFSMCLKVVQSERHIGIDQGLHNFAIVVVDTFLGERPRLVAAENFDLDLDECCTESDVLISLEQETPLKSWMQQPDYPQLLPVVDRVIVHIEQMSPLNRRWKQFGIKFGQLLQRSVVNERTCIVKLSQPNIHRATGPVFKLGDMIVSELGLTAPTYGAKQPAPATPQPSTSSATADNNSGNSTPVRKMQSLSIISPKKSETEKYRRTLFDDVEPSDDDDVEHAAVFSEGSDSDTEECDTLDHPGEYRQKKRMSADIFRYIIYADSAKEENLQIAVDGQVRDFWMSRLKWNARTKLDDVGDALLHALNEILCGGSNYKQLVPDNTSLHCNRTVVLAVEKDTTYWVVLHCTWNMFVLEDFGLYPSDVEERLYSDPRTATFIKKCLIDKLGTALTDTTGADVYHKVDHIKIVVKQLKGFKKFTHGMAGKLTDAAASAAKQICEDAAGKNNQLSERHDKIIGATYIQTDLTNGHKFQMVRSAAKHTNAMLSCLRWMNDNARDFVTKRTYSLNQPEKLKFFYALQDVACSPCNRLEMLEVSQQVKNKMIPDAWDMEDASKCLLADLILIGMNKNQSHVQSVAKNYRRVLRSAAPAPAASDEP